MAVGGHFRCPPFFYPMNRKCTLLITRACNLNCIYCYERHKSEARMPFETARRIVEAELYETAHAGRYDGVDFHFLGGEPLLHFDLIRDLCEWTWSEARPCPYRFYVITNGTLLDASRRSWFESHAGRITVDVSVDGVDGMHRTNRGCSVHELPVEWVHRCWPGSRFKMTVSRQTLSGFAEGVISLVDRGYDVTASLAVGERWTDADVAEYTRQWERLSSYYRSIADGPIWRQLLKSIDPLFDNSCVQDKCCGSGDSAVTYDVDGERYPCVIFTPLVSGQDMRGLLHGVRFDDPAVFADPACAGCFIRNMCKTCYGFNLRERGSLAERDKSVCGMFRVEIGAICSFQRDLLRSFARVRNLSDAESQRLRRAEAACEALGR